MSTRNPLIDDTMPDQSLHNASAVISYLQSVQPLEGCEVLGDAAALGLYKILDCVCSALDFEAGRVETLRKAAREAPGKVAL